MLLFVFFLFFSFVFGQQTRSLGNLTVALEGSGENWSNYVQLGGG